MKIFCQTEIPSNVVRIAKATVLLHNDYYDMELPSTFIADSTVLLYPHSDKMLDQFHPQQVEAVGHNVRIRNYSTEPIILEKNMHTFAVRAMKDATKIVAH